MGYKYTYTFLYATIIFRCLVNVELDKSLKLDHLKREHRWSDAHPSRTYESGRYVWSS